MAYHHFSRYGGVSVRAFVPQSLPLVEFGFCSAPAAARMNGLDKQMLHIEGVPPAPAQKAFHLAGERPFGFWSNGVFVYRHRSLSDFSETVSVTAVCYSAPTRGVDPAGFIFRFPAHGSKRAAPGMQRRRQCLR
jgi:hypothetical protein